MSNPATMAGLPAALAIVGCAGALVAAGAAIFPLPRIVSAPHGRVAGEAFTTTTEGSHA